jgi:outer membrane protein OmpA-like peptidoglycan-associated protein
MMHGLAGGSVMFGHPAEISKKARGSIMRKLFFVASLFLLAAGSVLAQDEYPKVETAPSFMYIHYVPGANLPSYNCVGGGGTIAYNLNKWVGLAADLGGCKVIGLQPGLSANTFTYLFGPRFTYRSHSRITPFFEVNFGGDRLSADCNNLTLPRGTCNGSDSWNAFGMTAGGGFDIKLTSRISWRVIQAEYFYTRFGNNIAVFNNVNQNNFRLKSGIVIGWGGKPPKAPNAVTASCSVDPSSVVAGSNQPVTASANSSNTYGLPMNYSWAATGGKVDGTGAQARWDSTDVAPGTYSLTAKVDDGHGVSTSCSADVTVNPKPVPPPPTMRCSSDPSSVLAGARSTITASANDSTGTPLTYQWQTNGGQIVGSGASVQLDTTGLAPGDYAVTGRVANGVGGAGDCSASVNVQAPPAVPQASKIGSCNFKSGSAKVDNVCKRVLDDAAIRLQNDPKATVVLVGYADPAEKQPDTLSKTRGDNASQYLSKEKGVSETRAQSRSAAGQQGAGQDNYRVDVIFVPDGASY